MLHELIKSTSNGAILILTDDSRIGMFFTVVYLHASFLLLSCITNLCNSEQSEKFTLVHTSDIHLHLPEGGSTPAGCKIKDNPCHGGLPRFVRFIDTLKEDRANLLIVDSGGLIPGELLQVEGGQEVVTELVKPLPYDAMAFGALELSGGLDALAKYVKIVGQKFVCTNLEFSNSSASGRYLSKNCHSFMIKMYGALQVGILSYISSKTTKSIPGITVKDEITSLEHGINQLNATSGDIDVILVLGYSHMAMGEAILKKIPKINVLTAGHSHMMFYNGTPPNGAEKDLCYPYIIDETDDDDICRTAEFKIRTQMIIGAYFHLIYVGKLKINSIGQVVTVEEGSNPQYLNGEKDPATEKLLVKHNDTFNSLLGPPISFSGFLVDGSRACWRRECAMGNLLADAMVDAAVVSEEPRLPGAWTVSATALLESGRIAANLERGVVHRSDVLDLMWKDTGLNLLDVTGAELRQLLENATRQVSAGSQSFLQVSGLQVTGQAGHLSPQLNISVLCVQCEVAEFRLLNDTASYTVVVTRDIVSGLPEGIANESRPLHESLFKAAEEYIEKISPVLIVTGSRLMHDRSAAAGPAPGGPAVRWLPAALLLARARTVW